MVAELRAAKHQRALCGYQTLSPKPYLRAAVFGTNIVVVLCLINVGDKGISNQNVINVNDLFVM